MNTNSKAAEFEAEAMARLARIREGGKTLKLVEVKKLVRGNGNDKKATNSKQIFLGDMNGCFSAEGSVRTTV